MNPPASYPLTPWRVVPALDGTPTLKPDFCVLGIDETREWNLPARLMDRIEKIVTVYAFNRACATYCCEVTPSYWLQVLDYDAHLKAGTPEKIREEIYEELLSINRNDGDSYMHVSQIESLIRSGGRLFHSFGDNDGEQVENCVATPDWLYESWSSNPLCTSPSPSPSPSP